MRTADPISFSGLELRASRRYELVPFERLGAMERRQLAELTSEPDFFGVLRPAGDSTHALWKAVDVHAALLLYTLREPGPLPEFARRLLDPRRTASWIADGVLEVRHGDRFVSGAEALELLAPPEGHGAGGRLAELSHAALSHAAAFADDGAAAVSRRLYAYYRLPVSERWQRRFPGPAAVEKLLGLETGSSLRRRLDGGWYPAERGEDGWLAFARRESAPAPADRPGVFKLYFSPAAHALAETFASFADLSASHRAHYFKVGANAWGLLRPDKAVAYFDAFDDLAAAAEKLTERLAGTPEHGVAFTAEITGRGLLSWGLDPLPVSRALVSPESDSWRSWLCRRLGAALVTTGSSDPGERSRFALERLRLDGFDVETWRPTPELWRTEAW